MGRSSSGYAVKETGKEQAPQLVLTYNYTRYT